MIKKIILSISFLIAFSVSNAQRLNSRGEKMVKEIEYYNGGTHRFVYEYDDNDNMISLTLYDSDNKFQEKYYKEGNKIKYRGDGYSISSFDLNEHGMINHGETTLLQYDKTPVSKHEEFFDYILEDGRYRLDVLHKYSYNYDIYEKRLVKNDINFHFKVVNNNGIYQSESDWVYEIDPKHPNDTNISFYNLITPNIGMSSLYFDYLMLTDWINIKGKYFPKYKNGKYKVFSYIYDEKGNITEIDYIWNEKYLQKYVKIKYVD